MAEISQIKLPDNTVYDLKDTTARNTGKVSGVKGNSESSYRTGDVNLTADNIGAVNKNGDTMTGTLNMVSDQLYEENNESGLNLNNSDIIGINGIYFNDIEEDNGKGINFKRDDTHLDSFYLQNGNAYVVDNKEINEDGEPLELQKIKLYEVGTIDPSVRSLVDQARANRLAFLPANQVIIETTTNGGTTWQNGNFTDSQKEALFSVGLEGNSPITIPLLNGVKSSLCGLRITITGMKYNIPINVGQIYKYSYWNKSYANTTERYFMFRELWFWVTSQNDRIKVQVEAASGEDPTNWINYFNKNLKMYGWPGSNWLKIKNRERFGGFLRQPEQKWNWRFIFWTIPQQGSNSFNNPASAALIYKIKGFGDQVFTSSNNLMKHDHMYDYDKDQNVIFPGDIKTNTGKYVYSNAKKVLVGGSNSNSTVTITPSTTDVYSMTSDGSVTAGTATTPASLDISKFNGGSFTGGAFTAGSLTFAIDQTDNKQLNISFTAPSHAADSFTAASLGNGFYTAGTKGTPTAVTLPTRSSNAIKAWTGYSSATAAAQTFTGQTS